MRWPLALVGGTLALFGSAGSAPALTLTTLEDSRGVSTSYNCGSLNPCTAAATPSAPGAWDVSLPETSQSSDIGPLGMSGSGDVSGGGSTRYGGISKFLVEFSLDEAAAYSFAGSLTVPGTQLLEYAAASLCTSSTCSDGTVLTYDQLDGPTYPPSRAFSYAGELLPGQYFLLAEAHVQGVGTGHFDFTFDVSPLPEPGIAGLTLLALLPLARSVRRE